MTTCRETLEQIAGGHNIPGAMDMIEAGNWKGILTAVQQMAASALKENPAEQVDLYRSSLKAIADPIMYLRMHAEQEKQKLSPDAVKIANDPAFLQQIAKDALEGLHILRPRKSIFVSYSAVSADGVHFAYAVIENCPEVRGAADIEILCQILEKQYPHYKNIIPMFWRELAE